MLDAVIDPLFSLVYPQECRICSSVVEKRADGAVCDKCWAETRLFTGAEMLCGRCGAYLGEKAATIEVFCTKCDDHSYDQASALGVYEKALSASILVLKGTPLVSKRLSQLISSRAANFSGFDLIMPIPLSKKRRLERGFNQAEIIAGKLASVTAVPVDSHSLVRHADTHIHRVGMDQKARELSVKNAFSVARPKLVDGKRILLVDDVFTSGATASNCAKVLKKSGASEVSVFTIARAVMHYA